ncbi:MAG: TRIC cation channel family protein [Parasporobacterium sp.]|nr:TRIC cation channel family protein [Parasporobacterium sp.]
MKIGTQEVIFIIEILGTIAFAASGAIVAVEKKMDILGVIILGITTAVGGGVIRDVILGITPPATFRKPVYAIVAAVVSIIVFIAPVRRWLHKRQLFEPLMMGLDALGLGVFTVVGISAAKGVTDTSGFLQLFTGVVTGVGGGILRDMMAQRMPYVFVKHFYASASIIGGIICILVWKFLGEFHAIIIGTAVVFILRVLAAIFKWSLPKATD